ncbi:hypothetical protein AOLI_G00040530 [Acnodon oligacanthus]
MEGGNSAECYSLPSQSFQPCHSRAREDNYEPERLHSAEANFPSGHYSVEFGYPYERCDFTPERHHSQHRTPSPVAFTDSYTPTEGPFLLSSTWLTGYNMRSKSKKKTLDSIPRPPEGHLVLLKVCMVILRNGDQAMETFAILDNGSKRIILLQPAAQELAYKQRYGAVVSFTISLTAETQKVFHIKRVFTAKQLGLAEHTHPVEILRQRYGHLRDLPLLAFKEAHLILLIFSDHPVLITAVETVHLGPPGGPAAIRAHLSWTL